MIETTTDINELAASLALAQGQIESAKRTAQNPHLKNQYATLDSVWEAIRKPLSDNGLSIVQSPSQPSPERLCVTTILLHKSGQRLWDTLSLPVAQQTAQGVGSAITYARRYALMAIVGIAPDDDDGHEASNAPKYQQSAPNPYQKNGNGNSRQTYQEEPPTEQSEPAEDPLHVRRMAAKTEWAKRAYNAEALKSVIKRNLDEPADGNSRMFMTFQNLTEEELKSVEKALRQTNAAAIVPPKAEEIYTPEPEVIPSGEPALMVVEGGTSAHSMDAFQ